MGINHIKIMKRIIVAMVMVVFLSPLCYSQSAKPILNRVVKKERLVGMTRQQIKKSFGKPDHEVKATVSNVHYEQWVYGTNEYLNFKSGHVTQVFVALSN